MDCYWVKEELGDYTVPPNGVHIALLFGNRLLSASHPPNEILEEPDDYNYCQYSEQEQYDDKQTE